MADQADAGDEQHASGGPAAEPGKPRDDDAGEQQHGGLEDDTVGNSDDEVHPVLEPRATIQPRRPCYQPRMRIESPTMVEVRKHRQPSLLGR